MKMRRSRKDLATSNLKAQKMTVKGELMDDEFSEELSPASGIMNKKVMKTAPNMITTADKSVFANRKD